MPTKQQAGKPAHQSVGPPLAGADADRLVAVLVEIGTLVDAAARCARNRSRSLGDLVVWLALLRESVERLEAVLVASPGLHPDLLAAEAASPRSAVDDWSSEPESPEPEVVPV